MNRSATSVYFGFDFQTNAAIILMLENMAEMDNIRIEGEEDIQIKLNDGTYILAQAKSVVNSSTDFGNVRTKAKDALKSLSEAAHKLNARELIYITNSPNPFNDEASKPLFSFDAHVKFNNLPDVTKEMLTGWLKDMVSPLDTNNLKVQILPFETDDDKQKYRVVLWKIAVFIDELDIDAVGMMKRLHEVWTNALNRNGTRKDTSITIQKKAIVWPIIVYVSSKGKLGREAQYFNLMDNGEYEEVVRRYDEVIDSYSERFDFVTKVITDFATSGRKEKDAIADFINQQWETYKDDICDDSLDESIRENLIKVILYNILSKRFDINQIKKAVNL